jgi:hypothetical protein
MCRFPIANPSNLSANFARREYFQQFFGQQEK